MTGNSGTKSVHCISVANSNGMAPSSGAFLNSHVPGCAFKLGFNKRCGKFSFDMLLRKITGIGNVLSICTNRTFCRRNGVRG